MENTSPESLQRINKAQYRADKDRVYRTHKRRI